MFQACFVSDINREGRPTYGSNDQDVVVGPELVDHAQPHMEAQQQRDGGERAEGNPERKILAVSVDGHVGRLAYATGRIAFERKLGRYSSGGSW